MNLRDLIIAKARYGSIIGSGGSGGGGSSNDVVWGDSDNPSDVSGKGIIRYVTFKNHDGSAVYGRKSVVVGDDCANPISRGLMPKPTREPDAQYNYTYYGWATTPNGAADSNALKAVNEDRTVYANFSKAVRYYTITYYDSDGTTVLKTESLAHGAMPSYKPEKEGVIFDRWVPALSTVLSDVSYIANWSEMITFAEGTWADIIRISEAGEAKKYFDLGDTKRLYYTDTTGKSRNALMKIVGFDKDTLSDGTGKAGITVVTEKPVPAFDMHNQSGYTGWGMCNARTLLHEMTSSFPADLQSGLKTVAKITSKYVDGTDSSTRETTDDKIWLASMGDFGKSGTNTSYGIAFEGSTGYSGMPNYLDKSIYSSDMTNQGIITRTPSYKNQNTVTYLCTNTSASIRTTLYNNDTGFGHVFGFCI